jgi:hypothetical protein
MQVTVNLVHFPAEHAAPSHPAEVLVTYALNPENSG